LRNVADAGLAPCAAVPASLPRPFPQRGLRSK